MRWSILSRPDGAFDMFDMGEAAGRYSGAHARLRDLLEDANRGALTADAARSITLTVGDKSDCYYAWRQLQDAGAWVWDTNEMPENDPQRFEIMHAIQQAMGLLARRFTDKDLSLATEAKEDA